MEAVDTNEIRQEEGVAYKRPPLLAGYTYDPEDAYQARDRGRLLAIRLETNRSCNLRCRYCYAESGDRLDYELEYETLEEVVRQAAELGARSVVVIGGGEPTIHPRFRDLISCIYSLGVTPMVFTNTIAMTPDLAGFLHENGASVMGKLDSLDSELQDFMVGKDGAAVKIRTGLNNLLEAGFSEAMGGDERVLRLGVSCVTNRLNLGEIRDIWTFCRENRIFPNLEVLTPTGRAKGTLDRYCITNEEVRDYKLDLLELDRREYGFDWLPYTPLPGSGCLQHLYSLYVTIKGDVRPCAPTKFDENPDLFEEGSYPHNVRRRPLRDIYEDPLFEYVRNIDKELEGRCGACEHLGECIGCRGYVYSVGVNGGKGPLEALRGECPLCFKE